MPNDIRHALAIAEAKTSARNKAIGATVGDEQAAAPAMVLTLEERREPSTVDAHNWLVGLRRTTNSATQAQECLRRHRLKSSRDARRSAAIA